MERHSTYWPLVEPVWLAAKAKNIEIVSSELALLETLVGPLKVGNTALAQAYEQLFQQAQTRLLPITQSILRNAAQLRASTGLKAPDAIHATTAIHAGCAIFVTNDKGFRGVAGLNATLLGDLLTP